MAYVARRGPRVFDSIAPFTASKSVVYLDRGVIVLNKPPGLVCQGLGDNPNPDTPEAEIAANRKFSELLEDIRHKFRLPETPYPVHRLDRGTTGSLLLARTAQAARDLSTQFADHAIEKTYLALVRGGQQSFAPAHEGKIRRNIEIKNGRSNVLPAGRQEGKPSATDWELVASSTRAPVSLLRLKLLTGIKHQLRVHLASVLKAPILGDETHSQKPISESITNLTEISPNRMFLHSSQIAFYRYRKTGGSKRFKVSVNSPLPRDFLRICDELNIPVSPGDAHGGLFVDGEPVEGGTVEGVDGQWLVRRREDREDGFSRQRR